MATSTKLIKIPAARAEQLDELKALTGADSYGAVIGELITFARTLYPLKREVPGVLVNRIPEGVQIFFDGRRASGLSVAGTRALVAAIRTYIDSPTGARIATRDETHDFHVKGAGVLISIAIKKAKPVTYTPDLAAELADLLERTADREPSAANVNS